MILSDVFLELETRFLVNLPLSELQNNERLFFQIEQSFWFYEDFYADIYSHLPHMKLEVYTAHLFTSSSLLAPLRESYTTLLSEFKGYKNSIPVLGCILLNKEKTHVVLVRGWKGNSWTFPRGKINEGEEDIVCASREAYEECGYDASGNMVEGQFLGRWCFLIQGEYLLASLNLYAMALNGFYALIMDKKVNWDSPFNISSLYCCRSC